MEIKQKHGRTYARENSVKYLYSNIIRNKNEFDYNIKMDDKLAVELYQNALIHKNEFDLIITKYLKKWSINEVNPVIIAILYVALYEIIYTDTNNSIIINDALNLSKEYSDVKSKNFVHNVLGLYTKDLNE